jgi:hypothetical protein
MSYFKSLKGVPNYRKGLGYSPASGPGVGMPIITPGNFFEYNVSDLLPKQNSFGRNPNYNSVAFPGLGGFRNEVGPGNTPGGHGGSNGVLHYLPAPLEYWNYFGKSNKKVKKRSVKKRSSFGKKRRSVRKRKSIRKSVKKSKSRRKSVKKRKNKK